MPLTPAEKQAAYRERQALAEKDRGKPWAGLVGETREQAIRDYWGYGPSETRTEAERDAAAERMLAKARART